MAEARRAWKLLALLAAVGVTTASYRPVYRLNPQMPPEFVGPNHGVKSARQEGDIASLYWQSTVRSVQWKYGYGFALPDTAPPEFSLGTADLRSGSAEAAIRARYWHKVREIWPVPAVWNRQYEWSLDWMTTDLRMGGEWIQQQVERVLDLGPHGRT
jgi:hypothetical protein